MALKTEETKVVTIDGNSRAVDALPEEVRRLVNFYDDWKQRELEARSHLLMAQTAMRGLANEIVAAIQKADEEAASAGEPAEGDNQEETAE